MSDSIKLHYEVSGEDFTRAGAASSDVKRTLKQLGISPTAIRNVAIAMYEGEINMVIHAGGGEIDVEITESDINMILEDQGPGIENVELAMKEGYSTARLLCPWNFPGKNAGVGSHSLLQGIFQTQGLIGSPGLQADSLPSEPPGKP